MFIHSIYNMGFFGEMLGNAFGKLGSHFLPIDGVDGGKLGSKIGSWMPFKKGGRVPGKYTKALHASMGSVKVSKKKSKK